jgi:two-component system, OmpR family, sensor histidine kinase CreC
MRLGLRIFLTHLLIFWLCFYFPTSWLLGSLRFRYLEGVEDPLVDQAIILAAIVGAEMEQDRFDSALLQRAFEGAYSRQPNARIYEFVKTHVDARVYLTDRYGKVIFDSVDASTVGKDYSSWRDVVLTLRGEYGARTTLGDPDDPKSSVLFVAAPITVHGEIAGALSVAKPTTNINDFLKQAEPKFIRAGILALLVAACLSLLFSFWLTRPIKRLTRYARDTSQGKRTEFPPDWIAPRSGRWGSLSKE